ncbi:plasmid mobilization protein [uncultured Anaeromusa sp.]|uniref:plasmid mobilization protein n=1 Tax=uncultured Anaeromusa sp. TaxID=673273 RepID=UPI0029C87837|nr:hypothetical protein [uncultured Anaeromusa sp.]
MFVNNAWHVKQLPNEIVLELVDGRMVFAPMTPFRELNDSELHEYKGYHPRKCSAEPIPGYLYRFYGLEKNEEIASEWVKVRLRPSEKEKLEQAAKDANQNVSEFIRAFVQGL